MNLRRFEAYSECPKCGRLDHHLLREPNPAPTEAEMQEWEQRREFVEIRTFGSHAVRRDEVGPPPPVDESQFEVIRICKCGNEFGQM